MSEVLNNIYIDRFLLVVFVKYILSQIYSYCIWNCTFWYFMEIVENGIFFYPKTSNFLILGMVGRKKLPDTSMSNIFNVLSIDLQYTLSFKWPDFGLKCRVTTTPKDQSLKFKASVLYEIFPFLKQGGIAIHFLNFMVVTQLLLWNRKERLSLTVTEGRQLGMSFLSQLGFQRVWNFIISLGWFSLGWIKI